VKRLLAQNIDINARYPNDLTLLMWASGPDEKAPEAQAAPISMTGTTAAAPH
jgi:hypothetical protein